MSCGRRKRNVRSLLHILLRSCECARVWSVQKVRTEAGKQEIFHKRERQKKGEKCRYGWKKHDRRHPQNAKDSGKNRDDGKEIRQTPTQDRQKKMLREPKNTGMADKKTASSIRKTQKIPEKNRDDGGKTRQEPAQD